MQPNATATPWDSVRGLVTAAMVISWIIVGLGLLSLIPGSGFSTGDSLENQMCITVSKGESLYDDESTFRKTSESGVMTSAESGRAYCKPYDAFEHSYAARVLSEMSYTPMAIVILGLVLGLRRIIKRTWDTGPYHLDAVRLLDRFRWWAAGAVAAAVAIQWVVKGVKLQLLTDEPWPGGGIPWSAVVVWVIATVITTHCENVARRRDDGAPPALG